MTETRATIDDSRAWTKESLVDPHHDTGKAVRVNAMFDAIAERYDLNNRVHSLWMDQSWRRRAVRLAEVRAGVDDVVDAACGTGDLAMAFAAARPKSVMGIDFVPKMIELAKRKVEARGARKWGRVGEVEAEFRVGDVMNVDLPDASADIVSIAFGIRNVEDAGRAVGEFRRILRPGGRLVILEFGEPKFGPLRWAYHLYSRHIMPRTATWIAGDRTGAYRYLPRSVATFLDRGQMVGLMQDAGFTGVTVHPMTFGICVGYVGRVEKQEVVGAARSN